MFCEHDQKGRWWLAIKKKKNTLAAKELKKSFGGLSIKLDKREVTDSNLWSADSISNIMFMAKSNASTLYSCP